MTAATESTVCPELAGAMAHLARAIKTGCRRSAHLCALLLDRVANAPGVDDHIRAHAQELFEAIEGEALIWSASPATPSHPHSQPLCASTRTSGHVISCH